MTTDHQTAAAHAPDAATHYVLGGNHVGHAIATTLQAAGHPVTHIDDTHPPDPVDGATITGDPAAVTVLDDAGLDTAEMVLVVTPADRRTLLISSLVAARYDATRIVPVVHHPDRVPLFTDAGHDPVCVTSALADTISTLV